MNESIKGLGFEEESEDSSQKYIHYITGRYNLTKFIKDNQEEQFDKLCLITIGKGEILPNLVGRDNYNYIINHTIDLVEGYLKKNYVKDSYAIYIYNSYSFFIVVSKSFSKTQFMRMAEELYSMFGIIKYREFDYTCISRYILLVEQEKLIDKMNCLMLKESENENRFLVYGEDSEMEARLLNENHMVNIIREVIEEDGVIPYFQPLYDNQQEHITEYESLMRIRDKEGTIYTPGEFMDVAKEYGLYMQLSKSMILKVFELFRGRKESVSINLSAYDINSTGMRELIFHELEKTDDASNFIFEILESENFRDPAILVTFIEEVRKYHVRIAVDDFGAGFTNLMEIANLNPDFIKIDGQIIRGVLNHEVNKKIVGTIKHLANALDMKVVAEYVENKDLQDYISSQQIDLSQGYHFSEPKPFDEIVKSSQNER